MIRYIVLMVILAAQFLAAGNNPGPASRASGIFVGVGVGPRVAILDFAEKSNLGYGFRIEVSYTDNEFLPVFLYAETGFEHFPGSQDYYQESQYTHFSTSYIPLSAGVRTYLPPLDNLVFIMPFIEASAKILLYQELNEFNADAGRSDFIDDGLGYGFSIGAGASMFVLEIAASYNYYHPNHFLNVDLRVRLPLYVSI